jgi:hypothetical protein
MLRLSLVIITILAAPPASVAAYAQGNGGAVAPELARPTRGHLLNRGYITSTGATVPRPGVSQSAGPTALDRSIERKDNRIDNSICKAC